MPHAGFSLITLAATGRVDGQQHTMKTAIYIENGSTQLVLTPENDWEKQVVRCIEDGHKTVRIICGSFYECRGGFFRQDANDESLILRTGITPKDEHGREIPTS